MPRALALTVLAFVALAFASCGAPEPIERPNIILIISDDHGWPYYGFMGHEIVKTPNLDRLAAGGLVFPNAFSTASTCQPALQSLLTGLYPVQWQDRIRAAREAGHRRRQWDRIIDFETLPKRLAERGYASFQGGKFWEGPFANAGFSHGMTTEATPDVIAKYGEIQAHAGGYGLELGRTTMQPLFDFMDEHREQPFFVWFAPKLPHTPHDAGDEYEAVYEGETLSPEALRYYANITRFDDVVGQLVDHLDETRLLKKTLIVYLADNGWEQDPDQRPIVRALGGPKGKSSMHEMGFRTPMIFSWPRQIEAGATDDRLVSAVDLYPTLLDLAGAGATDRPGISVEAALLRREGSETPRRDHVIGSSAGKLRPPPDVEAARADPNEDIVRRERAYFIRTNDWHYTWYADSARYGDRPTDRLDPVEAGQPKTATPADDAHGDLTSALRREIEEWLRIHRIH